MEEHQYTLAPDQLTELIECDEDDLGDIISEIFTWYEDPKDDERVLDGFVYGGMPGGRYTLDSSSAEISYAEFTPGDRNSGKIHIDFTASNYLGCRDVSDIARDCSNTVNFRIEHDPPRLVIWDYDRLERHTDEEF